MKFLRVTLQVPKGRSQALRDFYGGRLGLATADPDRYALGPTELVLEPGSGEPFYHFALLVPGDRFDAALGWAAERVELLPGGDRDEIIFDFDGWDACACYFHDPAGNIVELIAHRGVGENRGTGEFHPRELLGFSELGLVGNPRAIADALERLGLHLWDGELDQPGRLAFLGERARTLILTREGRGWLPTGRPSAVYRANVLLEGRATGDVTVCGYHVAQVRGRNDRTGRGIPDAP
jgi:catechol 2,3-dioxygenase-like lactoylglutathione lyase family enzyme